MSVPSYIARTALAAFLLGQVVVPTVQLFQPRPARFGWQMYTAKTIRLEVEARFADRVEKIEPTAFVGYFRSEIDYGTFLPPLICQKYPSALSVTMNGEVFICAR